ncbi:phage major capsid protein [Alphaproteobacteria bacterium]|nr:phage major capsid protein [Alphaproteobacteria bacterium]
MTLNKQEKKVLHNETNQESESVMQMTPSALQKEDHVQKRFSLAHDEAASHGLSVKNAFTNYMRQGDDQMLKIFQQKSLSSTSGSDGGYAVPTEVGKMLSDHLTCQSPLRQVANVMNISTEAIEFLMDVNEADAGWVTEAANRPETEAPKFKKKRISVHEMYAAPRATQKLLDDAHIDIEDWLVNRVCQKMAAMESQSFLHGDGNTSPRGILNYSLVEKRKVEDEKLQHLVTGVDGDFDKETGADILIEAVNQIKGQDLQGACWLMSRSAYARIRKLKDQFGNYLWMPGLDGGHHGTLFGYPVFICDAMPELEIGKESTSIIFGNFKRAYQIVDRNRERLSILRDEYTYKPFVEFYVTSRFGGDMVNFDALRCITFKKKT